MTITVSCPACSTSFPVDPAKIPPDGVRAQCSACPEIFDVDKPDQAGAEPTFAEPTETFAEPAAPVESEETEVPPEVRSPFGADAKVVSGIAQETTDEFGGRELAFDSAPVETDEGLAADADLEVETTEEYIGEIDVEAPAEEAPAEEVAPSPGAIQFGKRTPEDKARSLARSLVSDLIAYNPDKHTEALASGTLVEAFGEEIEKSWKDYREQVDSEVLAQGRFFDDALNELLADGESVFNVEG